MNWFYVENGQSKGPISEAELKVNLATGRLDPDSFIWREGMSEWTQLKIVFASTHLASPELVAKAVVDEGPDYRPEAHSSYRGSLIAGATRDQRNTLAFTFTGTWQGYYKVWFIGLIFTILTLGLYAPWAKVRNRKYIYGHTRLGADAFDYRADPRRMLVGQLIMAGLVVLWMISSLTNALLPILLICAGLLLVPWIITQSLRFNARATVWRGLRFGFNGSPFGCLYVFALLPLICLGVFWPAAARARRRWLVGNHRFGAEKFHYNSDLFSLYGIYIKGIFFFIPAGICYFGVMLNAYFEKLADFSPDGVVNLPLPYFLINLMQMGPMLLPFMLPVAMGGVDFLTVVPQHIVRI